MSKGENMVERATEIAEMRDGVMYASASYGGNPISEDRLEYISRWGGASPEEARCMAADLWQRRKGEQFAASWAEAKAAVKARYLRTALSQPNDEGEGK